MKVEQDPNLSPEAQGTTADPAHPASGYQKRREQGRAARRAAPRGSHTQWALAPDRPDPIDLLQEQDRDRFPELVPIRYSRMMASPFAFLRGSAIVMANDLAHTPRTGIQAQLCGDAHLSNFGAYASPERALLFDLNDFDETLPGPWEWDIKRLAASLVVAGRDSLQALSKLTGVVDGRRRIIDDPPLLTRIPEGGEIRGQINAILESYKRTLQEDRRHLLERYRFVDAARKVVGVGSVGRRAYVVLLEGRDEDDPLFLQVKEAGPSVLEGHVATNAHEQHGHRVEIASYLGKGERFEEAIADFAKAHADQTERDHAALCAAVKSGRVPGDPGA